MAGMRTLDKWVGRLLKVPSTIECPVMKVWGRDFEPAIFEGPGYISVLSRTEMEFVLHAVPRERNEAYQRLINARKNPHSIHDKFRLTAVEYDGVEWTCGWVDLRWGEVSNNVWRLSGFLKSISTVVSGALVSPDSGVEVVFDQKIRIPMQMNMVTTVLLDDKEVLWSRGQGDKKVDAVGTTINFSHSVEGESIWAVASTSDEFCHPYAENWISEPLQLLLGQLVFPRLVARNQGGGNAVVSLRPSPVHKGYGPFSSILAEDPLIDENGFWQLYCDVLNMLVSARDASGHPNFQSHPLTHYSHEVVQATSGSLWVLCMTLASAIEGVVKLLVPPENRKSDIDPRLLADLKQHVRSWRGDDALRDRVISSLAFFQEKGTLHSLRDLCAEGVVERGQVKVWQAVRNQVMHGNLVSPWLDEELENRINELFELFRKLSRYYISSCNSLSDVH